MNCKTITLLARVFILLAAVTIAVAGVPQLISYQGYLSDNLGNPLDGSYQIEFAIYTAPTGGSLVWSETRTINVDSGAFNVHLGEISELTESVFSDSARYLGITVESDPEMPRSRMTSSPYAYRIATVDGSISKKLVLTDTNNTQVELGVGTNVLRVFDSDGWLRVRISIDSTGSKDGRGIDGGGAISFFKAGVLKKGEEELTRDGAENTGSLVRIGESVEGTGEISTFDPEGRELARMTSTALDGGAYYTYLLDSTRLTVQGQATDTGGYIGTFGKNGNRATALSSLSGNPGYGFISTQDSTGTSRTHMFTDYGADGHLFLRNHFGTTSVEMSNYGDAVTAEGGFVHVFGPNGNLNAALWFLGGNPNNGYMEVFDSLGVSQAGMYVDASGNGIVYGDQKNFKMDNPLQPGTEIWYASIEGPEAGTYFRGTAKLTNGRAVVYFPDHFKVVASPEGMTVQVVPLSADSKGLAVIEKHADHIIVQELQNGAGSYEFDFTISAVRKGYENYQIVRPVENRVIPTKSASRQLPVQSEIRKTNPDSPN